MFENCSNLAELNQARVKACSAGESIVAVNNAYNSRRKELLTSTVKFTRIKFVANKVNEDRQLLSTLPYISSTDKPGTIRITREGVYA